MKKSEQNHGNFTRNTLNFTKINIFIQFHERKSFTFKALQSSNQKLCIRRVLYNSGKELHFHYGFFFGLSFHLNSIYRSTAQ